MHRPHEIIRSFRLFAKYFRNILPKKKRLAFSMKYL